MENNLKVAKIKYETGVASEAEYLQLQSEMAAKKAALTEARMYYEISASDLANFCGFADRKLLPEEMERDGTFEALLQDLDPQTISPVLEDLCLSRNLTLKTLEENIKLNKINRSMALSTSLPALNLIYEKSWDDDFDLDSDKDESTSLMLTASLPLLPLADTFCNYKKEQHQVKKAQREFNSASQGIKLQVYSTLLALVSSVNKLESSQLALEYAKQTLLQIEERYRNNLASANDLLNVSLLKQSSEITLLQDQIDLIKYKSELKKLLNLKSDEELKQLLINI
jgi:outer membrane protein TolC